QGLHLISHESNYFIGNDPEKWVTGARSYNEVRYPSLYDGIDLRYYLLDGMLKYDFIVRPSGDPGEIALRLDGTDAVDIDSATGDLLISTPSGSIRDEHPLTFQETTIGRNIVPSGFKKDENDCIGFDLGDYDPDRIVVIDPGLNFSSYLGGSDGDYQHSSCLDSDSNIFIAGHTNSTDFPTTPGGYERSYDAKKDLFICKMDKNGSSLEFSTYIGGSEIEWGPTIEVDALGYIYLAATSESTDFPLTSGVVQNRLAGMGDVVVLK
ncbi:unnamed protein product, partial [marine sediment metagenome]